nr:hypothetical protein [Rhizobium sp. WL3]
MDELPPHDERTGQPFFPDPERHRRHPLRNPQHRCTLLPLIGSCVQQPVKRHRMVPFLIPASGM